MALGAAPRNILVDVLQQGLVIAAIGVVAGAVFGVLFALGIGKYVAEVKLPGFLSFAGSALVILAAATIASALPAARAARVNAVEALRSE
jgi:ABC-type antimicrobial peptide transport system permease subunit